MMNKKNILLGICLPLLLIACSQSGEEEDVAVAWTPVPLQLSATIGEAEGTRAVVQEVSTFAVNDAIGVSGTYKDMEGADQWIVNKAYKRGATDGKETWSSEAPFYFQNANEVTFRAYYPQSKQVGTDGTWTNAPTADYLFAEATGSVSSKEVSFTFDHGMTKMYISFKQGYGVTEDELQKMSGAELHVGPLYTTGTVDVKQGTATGDGTLDYIGGTISLNDGTPKGSVILFPQTLPEDLYVVVQLGGNHYQGKILSKGTALAAMAVSSYQMTIHKTGLTLFNGIGSWEEVSGEAYWEEQASTQSSGQDSDQTVEDTSNQTTDPTSNQTTD